MANCKEHKQPGIFCYDCVLDLSAKKNIILGRLRDRLDALESSGTVTPKTMMRFEDQFPVSGIKILSKGVFSEPPDVLIRLNMLKSAHDVISRAINDMFKTMPQRRGDDVMLTVDEYAIYLCEIIRGAEHDESWKADRKSRGIGS